METIYEVRHPSLRNGKEVILSQEFKTLAEAQAFKGSAGWILRFDRCPECGCMTQNVESCSRYDRTHTDERVTTHYVE